MLKFIPTPDEANLFNTHANEAHQFAVGDSYLYEMSKSVDIHLLLFLPSLFTIDFHPSSKKISDYFGRFLFTWPKLIQPNHFSISAPFLLIFYIYIFSPFLSCRIPHFEQRLKALFYQKVFSERIGDLKPKIECKSYIVSFRTKKVTLVDTRLPAVFFVLLRTSRLGCLIPNSKLKLKKFNI